MLRKFTVLSFVLLALTYRAQTTDPGTITLNEEQLMSNHEAKGNVKDNYTLQIPDTLQQYLDSVRETSNATASWTEEAQYTPPPVPTSLFDSLGRVQLDYVLADTHFVNHIMRRYDREPYTVKYEVLRFYIQPDTTYSGDEKDLIEDETKGVASRRFWLDTTAREPNLYVINEKVEQFGPARGNIGTVIYDNVGIALGICLVIGIILLLVVRAIKEKEAEEQARLNKLLFGEEESEEETDEQETSNLETNQQETSNPETPQPLYTTKTYNCDEGTLTIEQEYEMPNTGETVLLNGQRPPDGKYKIGTFSSIYVEDGKVV